MELSNLPNEIIEIIIRKLSIKSVINMYNTNNIRIQALIKVSLIDIIKKNDPCNLIYSAEDKLNKRYKEDYLDKCITICLYTNFYCDYRADRDIWTTFKKITKFISYHSEEWHKRQFKLIYCITFDNTYYLEEEDVNFDFGYVHYEFYNKMCVLYECSPDIVFLIMIANKKSLYKVTEYFINEKKVKNFIDKLKLFSWKGQIHILHQQIFPESTDLNYLIKLIKKIPEKKLLNTFFDIYDSEKPLFTKFIIEDYMDIDCAVEKLKQLRHY
jgi:hypothetical protein